MKLTLLSLISLSFTLLIGNVTIANGQETNEQELKEFCQRFPYNQKCNDFNPSDVREFCINFPQDKRCADLEPLISLEERQGEAFYCSLIPKPEAKSKKCKIVVKDDQIIAYLEKGEALEALDNQEDTEEMVIDIKDVWFFRFHYAQIYAIAKNQTK